MFLLFGTTVSKSNLWKVQVIPKNQNLIEFNPHAFLTSDKEKKSQFAQPMEEKAFVRMMNNDELKMLRSKKYRQHFALKMLRSISNRDSIVKTCLSSLPVVVRHRDGEMVAIPHLDIYTDSIPIGLVCRVQTLINPVSLHPNQFGSDDDEF